MIIRKLTVLSAALTMAVSTAAAYADEGDMTRTRTQERVRTEMNLQTPTADQAQHRYRGQNMDQQAAGQQLRNQYRYDGTQQATQSRSATGAMNR